MSTGTLAQYLRRHPFMLAVVVTLVATLLRALLEPLIHGVAQYALYYFTVGLSAASGGAFAGIFALAFGALLGFYCFVYVPAGGAALPPIVFFQLGVFVVTALLIIALAVYGRRANAHLRSVAEFNDENPNPVLRVHRDGRVLFANPPGRALLAAQGWRPGSPVPEDFLTGLEKSLGSGRVEEFNLTSRERQVFQFSIIPVPEKGYVNFYGRDVTESRIAEEWRSAALDAAALGAWEYHFESGVVNWDERAREMWGFKQGQIDYAAAINAIHPEDRSRVDAAVKQALAGANGGSYRQEFRINHPDGSTHWVSSYGRVYFEGGQPIRFFGANRDITGRKKGQEALQKSEATLEAVLDALPVGVVIADAAGKLLRNNAAHRALWNAPPETKSMEQYGEWEGYWPDTGARIKAHEWALARSLRLGETVKGELVECQPFSPVRQRKFYLNNSAPIRDDTGRIIAGVAAEMDITERRRAEEAVRRSAEQLRLFVEQAPAALAMFDRQMRYVSVSCRWLREYGLEGRDVHGLSHYEVFPEIPENWRDVHRRALAGEVVQGDNDRFERTDGSVQWLKWEVRPWFDVAGQIAGIVIFSEDISARKRAEEALRASEERVRRKLDSVLSPQGDLGVLDLSDLLDAGGLQQLMEDFYAVAHVPMSIIDTAGRVLVGVGWQEICTQYHRLHDVDCRRCLECDTGISAGLSSGECRLSKCKNNLWDMATPVIVNGRHLGNIFTGQFFFADEAVDREAYRRQARQFGFDVEQYLSALDRVPRLERETVRHAMDFLVKLSGMLSHLGYSNVKLARSLSERDRLAESLRAAQSSAERARASAEQANQSKDQFLAVLSHELRTPLSPILAGVSLLERNRELTPVVRQTLDIIRRNVALEARLIDDLLDLTRIVRGKLTLERRPVDICVVIERAVETCRPDMDARKIDFRLDLQGAPYPVNGDVSRLQQVIWNLLNNAIKFTPDGGRVELRCRGEGGKVVIEVSDNGIGIEPHVLPKIFEAFEQGEKRITRQFGGLGLGLAITRRLVDMHDGEISAESRGRGRGAKFTVKFPLLEAQKEEQDRIREATGSPPAAKHILLVEDHADTAQMMAAVLESSGHQVKAVPDVSQALAASHAQAFDLILSDLGLPDGSGLDLMRELRKRGSHITGIALSGFGREEDVQMSREAGFSEHLTKPVDIDALLTVVERVTPH